ncbi:MAG: hypothetical protein LBL66_09645, partial [Clostridiales bacterium]|nr:hypothetical protein [Clostridiales bacterium]
MKRQNLIRVFAFVLPAALACFGFGGCRPFGKIDNSDVIDPLRTQIYVGCSAGGIGTEWLRDAAIRFEETQKEISYEDGKKGVEVQIDEDKDTYDGKKLINSISNSSREVFIVEGASNFYDYATSGKLMDVSDILEEKLSAFGETRSIADKMTEKQRNYYNVNGKYYALPHFEGYPGIVYDTQVFEEESLYFKAGGGFTGGADRAAGPDGAAGTYDDGLPATYDEFFQLCARMVSRGVTPIVWNGQYADNYVRHLLTGLWADYEGAGGFELNVKFSGAAGDIVTGFNGASPVTA